jgi:hypothetical protein
LWREHFDTGAVLHDFQQQLAIVAVRKFQRVACGRIE